MRITISIPDDLYSALVEQAGNDDRSMSYVVRDALKKTLPEATNGAVPATKAASVRKKVTEAKKATKPAAKKTSTPTVKSAAVRKRAAAKKATA